MAGRARHLVSFAPVHAGQSVLDVACGTGIMFFGDRVAALREMGRVARETVAIQVPGRLAESAGYQALTSVVARYADQSVVQLLASYFSVGEPELLRQLFGEAGLRIDRFATRQSATRLDSIDTFLAVEPLPLAEAVPAEVHRRIAGECRAALRPFIGASGAIAAPIEVHMIAAAPS